MKFVQINEIDCLVTSLKRAPLVCRIWDHGRCLFWFVRLLQRAFYSERENRKKFISLFGDRFSWWGKALGIKASKSRRFRIPDQPLIHTGCVMRGSAKNGYHLHVQCCYCCCTICKHPPWRLFPFFVLRHADVTLCLRALCGRGIKPWSLPEWGRLVHLDSGSAKSVS